MRLGWLHSNGSRFNGGRLVFLLAAVVAGSAAMALAGTWDAPTGYYSSASGLSGAALKGQLQSIMSSGHIQRSYGEFRPSARYHDADPSHSGNILLAYNRASASAYWDSGVTWNREHVWPQSRQPGSASNSTLGNLGDPHALRPCDPGINSQRSNKPFGGAHLSGSYRSYGSYWFPGDADKGDVARQCFYSATRYSDLSLDYGYPSGYEMGDLEAMLHWHYQDVPDEFERRRNHVVYSSSYNPWYYTNNRNAFIDRPEYAWSVYVDNANDTQLYVGSGAAGDGSSSQTVDLGPVIVGASAPGSQTVTLHKTGNDGTYYEVTVSGDATSSVTGRYNAFEMDASGSRTLTVGLNASTAAAGLKSGTITIDNLDVTTAGGSGHGGNDGDDTITVQMAVLSHSNGSFAAGYDDNTLTLDFGAIEEGSGLQQLGFDVYNTLGLAGYTADMIVSAVHGTGDTAELTTSFDASDVIAGSGSSSFWAYLDTATAGTYSATWTFGTADEALPGAAAGDDLVLTLLGEVTAASVLGDFNGNGVLDAGDIDLLSAAIGGGDLSYDLDEDGQVTAADKDMLVGDLIGTFYGDADLDLDVDDDDFDLLKGNYDASAGWAGGDFTGDGTASLGDLGMLSANYGQVAAGGTPIPEPATLAVLTLGGLACLRRRRRS